MSGSSSSDRLNSWKAIAKYLNKSERTARRWEADEDMPVHRHMHQSMASVYAYRSEIDEWLTRGEAAAGSDGSQPFQLPLSEQASVAVLPLDFVGPNRQDGYIADGFTDEIIADLAKLRSLRVISRTSSAQLKGHGLTAVQIAERLDVGYLLEGSVRAHDDNVRITVRLLDAHKDRQVWSEKYSAEVAQVMEMQERIAREVAAAMRLRLTDTDDRRLMHREISDWSTWLTVVQAKEQSSRWTWAGIDRAVDLLQAALRESGHKGNVHAALGRTYLQYREAGIDFSDRLLKKAERCAEKAVAADPESPDTFQILGWLSYSRGDAQAAVGHLKNALMRRWSDPESLGLLCNCYLISGKVAEARALIPQVQSMDPLSPLVQVLPAWADVLEGMPTQAIDKYRTMLEQQPQSPLARLFYTWVLAVNRRSKKATGVAAGFEAKDAKSLSARVARALAEGCSGSALNVEVSGDDRKMAEASDMYPRMLAQAYALAGDTESSLQWLSRAVSQGFINFPYLNEHDPVLTELKCDDRYAKLLTEVEQRWRAFQP
ncbi:MAG: tetratricopeptide repeat protein [Woeseiaceae bacterium]|nr:tetratricopeptide repeat protein [Woeseiaceae bacterium]